MTPKDIARLITEDPDILNEGACPECGAEAYHGFTNVECPTPGCKNYSAKQAAEVRSISGDAGTRRLLDAARNLFGPVNDLAKKYMQNPTGNARDGGWASEEAVEKLAKDPFRIHNVSDNPDNPWIEVSGRGNPPTRILLDPDDPLEELEYDSFEWGNLPV